MSNLLNIASLRIARNAVDREKAAFTPMDPSQMGGQPGGAAPGGAQQPQAAPIDPSQIQGIGAGAAGGDGGGGGAVNSEMVRQVLKQELQQILPMLQGGGGQGGGPMGPGGKPMKIDVGVELHRINVMLAKIIDALGIQIPATDMVTTEEQAQQPGAQNADTTGAQMPPDSSIAPMQPIQPAGPQQHQQHQQHQHQASDAALKFMNQGECNAHESILPLSTHAAALSLLLDHLPDVQENIA